MLNFRRSVNPAPPWTEVEAAVRSANSALAELSESDISVYPRPDGSLLFSAAPVGLTLEDVQRFNPETVGSIENLESLTPLAEAVARIASVPAVSLLVESHDRLGYDVRLITFAEGKDWPGVEYYREDRREASGETGRLRKVSSILESYSWWGRL